MKVSIITVVRNNKDTIRDAIESVLNQTYKNIEYIIIDGASNDGTIEIIQSYTNKIDKFISEPDNGMYYGLNKGIELSSGEIVCFLHSDDLYANNNIIQEVVDEFINNDIDGLYGDLIYTSKKDTENIIRYWKSRDFNISLLYKGWMPPHPTLFFKKDIYEKVGRFDVSFTISADYDFMLRALKSKIKVKYIPKILYKMRIGGDSNKSIKNIILKSKEDLQILKKNNIGGIMVLIMKNLSKIKQFINNKNI